MALTALVVALVLVAAGPARAVSPGRAVVFVRPSQGYADKTYAGQVGITDDGAGNLAFDFQLTGFTDLALRTLATHIHSYGDLTAALAEGGHWDPNPSQAHGCAPNPSRHAGDLGNLTVDASGNINQVITTTLPRFDVNSQYNFIGRMLVIHAMPDTCGGATGDAGARLAKGVIGWNQTDTPTTPTSPGELPDGSQYVCVLSPTSNGPNVAGTIVFQLSEGKVVAAANISGLAANSLHGIHIHQKGDISDTTGAANVLSHYMPDGVATHGCPQYNSTYHTGDMGAHQADAAGNIIRSWTVNNKARMAINNIQSILGRAVVVHANNDDCVSTTSSGARMAQCVIGTRLNLVVGTPVPTPTATPTSAPSSTPTGAASAVQVPAVVLALAALLAAVVALAF